MAPNQPPRKPPCRKMSSSHVSVKTTKRTVKTQGDTRTCENERTEASHSTTQANFVVKKKPPTASGAVSNAGGTWRAKTANKFKHVQSQYSQSNLNRPSARQVSKPPCSQPIIECPPTTPRPRHPGSTAPRFGEPGPSRRSTPVKCQTPSNQSLRPKTPTPKQKTPSPKQRTPSPIHRTPSPKQRTPTPKQRTPSPKQRTPTPKQRTPSPKQKTPSPTCPAVAPVAVPYDYEFISSMRFYRLDSYAVEERTPPEDLFQRLLDIEDRVCILRDLVSIAPDQIFLHDVIDRYLSRVPVVQALYDNAVAKGIIERHPLDCDLPEEPDRANMTHDDATAGFIANIQYFVEDAAKDETTLGPYVLVDRWEAIQRAIDLLQNVVAMFPEQAFVHDIIAQYKAKLPAIAGLYRRAVDGLYVSDKGECKAEDQLDEAIGAGGQECDEVEESAQECDEVEESAQECDEVVETEVEESGRECDEREDEDGEREGKEKYPVFTGDCAMLPEILKGYYKDAFAFEGNMDVDLIKGRVSELKQRLEDLEDLLEQCPDDLGPDVAEKYTIPGMICAIKDKIETLKDIKLEAEAALNDEDDCDDDDDDDVDDDDDDGCDDEEDDDPGYALFD